MTNNEFMGSGVSFPSAPVGHFQPNMVEQSLEQVNPARASEYRRTIGGLEDAVENIARAVTALDALEIQIVRAQAEIERLHNAGQPIDSAKVFMVIDQMIEHMSAIVRRAADKGQNLLEDSRLQLRFVHPEQMDTDESVQVDLTLISIGSLASLKCRVENDPVALKQFVDRLGKIVHANIHVLSSLILALFAARDYTNEVTGLALDLKLFPQLPKRQLPRLAEVRTIQNMSDSDRRRIAHAAKAELRAGDSRFERGRASLHALLERPIRRIFSG